MLVAVIIFTYTHYIHLYSPLVFGDDEITKKGLESLYLVKLARDLTRLISPKR